MYQTIHPFTGQDMRTIGPNPYAALGLGVVRPRRARIVRGVIRRRRSLRGLGQDDGSSVDLFSSYNPVTGTGSVYNNNLEPLPPDLSASSANLYAGSSSSNASLTNLLSTLTTQAGNIAKLVLTPGGSYTMTNPLTGQTITYQGTGQATTGLPLSIPGITSPLTSGDIIIAGGLVLLVILMGSHHG